MQPPEGYEHLDPEFWAKVEPYDGCWIYRSDSTSTPTYRGVSILVYVTGSHEPKNRNCTHRKCVRPSHILIGATHRDLETGEVPTPRKRRVRSQGQYNRWYVQC